MACIPDHPNCGKCGACGCMCPMNIEAGIRPTERMEWSAFSGSSSISCRMLLGKSPFFYTPVPPDLEEKLKKSEARRMEQSRQIMALMADLSTARTEAAQLKELIHQHYRDNEGHNHCWRNNFRLWEGAGFKPKELRLPPRDEAEEGCRAFWDELYSTPDRWPDFVQIGTVKDDGSK